MIRTGKETELEKGTGSVPGKAISKQHKSTLRCLSPFLADHPKSLECKKTNHREHRGHGETFAFVDSVFSVSSVVKSLIASHLPATNGQKKTEPSTDPETNCKMNDEDYDFDDEYVGDAADDFLKNAEASGAFSDDDDQDEDNELADGFQEESPDADSWGVVGEEDAGEDAEGNDAEGNTEGDSEASNPFGDLLGALGGPLGGDSVGDDPNMGVSPKASDEQLAWRETYFVLFSQETRPTLTQVEAAIGEADPRLRIENLQADEDGRFQSVLVQAPEDNAALEISYESGDAVSEQSTELAKTLQKEIDGEQLAQLLRADARLDVMHFERVGNDFGADFGDSAADGAADGSGSDSSSGYDADWADEAFAAEGLDPASLITVVEALARLTEGLPIDPAAGEVLI